jgi:hypothetical protein
MAGPSGDRDQTVLRFEEPDRNLSPVIGGREVCPLCGRLLEAFRCKLACECGCFMSCAEF